MALDQNSYTSGNVGNVVGINSAEVAYTRQDATFLDITIGDVYVSNYNITSKVAGLIISNTKSHHINVCADNLDGPSLIFHKIPSDNGQNDDIVGSNYGIPLYQCEAYKSSETEPIDWVTNYWKHYTENSGTYEAVALETPTWVANKYYSRSSNDYNLTDS